MGQNPDHPERRAIDDGAIMLFASMAHEKWRKGFDQDYAETGTTSKTRVKANSDGTEADINVPFGQLHPDWARENIAAAAAALEAIRAFPLDMEKAADMVHRRWMERNPRAEWNADQHIPYDQLPEPEKEKDRPCFLKNIPIPSTWGHPLGKPVPMMASTCASPGTPNNVGG